MSWKKKLDKWLKEENSNYLEIGERKPSWIKAMKEDLTRWKLPIDLIIKNPVLLYGKVPVFFLRKNPNEITE